MKSAWRPTDSQLRAAELTITDPYQQDGLVWAIPDGAALVDILNTYAFGQWPHAKCRCVKCDGHRHKYGYTALLSDGTKAMYGSKCGQDEFGESWEKATNRLRGMQKRQTLLLRLDALLLKLPGIVDGLGRWRDACERTRFIRNRFKSTMASLYAVLCANARRRDGGLMIYERVRDYAAEAQRAEKSKLDPKMEDRREPIYRWVNKVAYTVQGWQYFSDVDPVATVDEAVKLLRAIRDTAKRTDVLDTSVISGLSQRLRDCFDRLTDVQRMHQASLLFFTPANLAVVAEWATRTNEVEGTYRAEGRELIRGDEPCTMALPPRYPPLDAGVLDLLRRPEVTKTAA